MEASTTYCSGPFPKPQLTGVVERTPTQPVRNLSTLPLLRKPAHGRPLPSPRSVVQSQDVRTCSGPFRDDSSQAGGHKLAPGFGLRKGSGAGSGHGMGPRNSQKGLTLTSTRGALRQKFPIPPSTRSAGAVKSPPARALWHGALTGSLAAKWPFSSPATRFGVAQRDSAHELAAKHCIGSRGRTPVPRMGFLDMRNPRTAPPPPKGVYFKGDFTSRWRNSSSLRDSASCPGRNCTMMHNDLADSQPGDR